MPTIDLSSVEIHNSPDVRGWAETATITKLEFRPSGVHVEHTKNHGAGRWPNFRPAGWDGDLQYTLWLIENINGRWHGSGGIQFWQDCQENGGAPEGFAAGWFYAPDRWGVMTGHQPAAGDLVGFMVTAGDARNNGSRTIDERSNVVVIPFPRSGDVYMPSAEPLPPEVISPIPPTGHHMAELELRMRTIEQLVKDLDPDSLVHVGAEVSVAGTVRFLGPVSGKGTVTSTGR